MALCGAFRLGDDWEVLPLEGRVVHNGVSERLRPKAMDVLCLLALHAGDVVERDTLLAEIWGRTAVTDEPLTATVGELRRVLGDRKDGARYIETIPKRGYRLLSAVFFTEASPEAPPGSPRVPALAPPLEDNAVDDTGGKRSPSTAAVRARTPRILVALFALLLGGLLTMQAWREGDPPPLESPGSLAVLPFRVIGGGESEQYFGDGLAQEILTSLTRVSGLRVAARNSAFEFRDRADALAEIRSALGVDAVLDGSIRRDRERLRIQAQLTDTRTGFLLWADTYDRPIEDAFSLQSSIALALADRLSVTLADRDRQRLQPPGGRANSDAYVAYLRGRHLYETGKTEETLAQARALLERALREDPELTEARALLAGVWVELTDLGFVPPQEGYSRARKEAEAAIASDPALAEGHLMLGWVRMYHDWDWRGAQASLAESLALAPGDALVIAANAALNFHLGRMESAVSLAQMAVELDPLRAAGFYNLAYFRYVAGDLTGAERALRRVESLRSDSPRAGLLQVQIDLERGDVRAAAGRRESHPLLRVMADALISDARGDRHAAREALAVMERDYAETGAFQIAEIHAQLGNRDRAFHWLQRALAQRDPGLADLKVDRLLKSLHADPRYGELLAQVGFTRVDNPFGT